MIADIRHAEIEIRRYSVNPVCLVSSDGIGHVPEHVCVNVSAVELGIVILHEILEKISYAGSPFRREPFSDRYFNRRSRTAVESLPGIQHKAESARCLHEPVLPETVQQYSCSPVIPAWFADVEGEAGHCGSVQHISATASELPLGKQDSPEIHESTHPVIEPEAVEKTRS